MTEYLFTHQPPARPKGLWRRFAATPRDPYTRVPSTWLDNGWEPPTEHRPGFRIWPQWTKGLGVVAGVLAAGFLVIGASAPYYAQTAADIDTDLGCVFLVLALPGLYALFCESLRLHPENWREGVQAVGLLIVLCVVYRAYEHHEDKHAQRIADAIRRNP